METALDQDSPLSGRPLTLTLLGATLVASGGVALGRVGVTALFLHRYGAENLPEMYALSAASTILLSAIYLGALARFTTRHVYRAALLTCPLALALLVAAADAQVSASYPALWIARELTAVLVSLIVWGIASAASGAARSERLFPLVAGAYVVGDALGGFAAALSSHALGSEGLIGACCAALLLAGALLRPLLGAAARPAAQRADPALLPRWGEGLRALRGSRLVLYVALACFACTALEGLMNYLLATEASARFGDERQLASFFGAFEGTAKVAALAISLLVSRRFFARFGIISALQGLPRLCLIGFAALLVAPGLAVVAGFSLVLRAWGAGAAEPAYQAIFHAVPEDRREQARAFVEGVPVQLAYLATGLGLALADGPLDPRALSLLGVALAAASIGLLRATGRSYHQTSLA